VRCRVLVALALSTCASAFAASQGGPIPVPLPLFPGNNWWNTDVSAAPLDAGSGSFITHIGSTIHVHPDWGGDVGDGTLYGFPYILVDGSQALKTVTFGTPDESDGVNHMTNTSFPFYPIPDEAITNYGWIEDGKAGNIDDRPNSDRHMLIVDTTDNTLFELYSVFFNGTNWVAGSGAFFDMNTNNRRPDTWTSADAAGLAILPGLVRYDEVYGPNEITHAFRFTVRDSNGYVFPGSHNAGSTAGALPMGGRLRLKASFDISTYPTDVQKILRALKKYGLIVADNGSDMYIQGNYSNSWDMDVMNTQLGKLTANDFEVVQQGWKPSMSFILTLPSAMGNGDVADATLTAYDSNYNLATGYRGTVHFTSTDLSATLPLDYTFTAVDAGTHTFSSGFTLRTPGGQTVYATDVSDATITTSRNVIVGPPTPTGLSATATTTTHVDLSWNPASGASQYEIQRLSASSSYSTIATVIAPMVTYPDTTVAAGATYVYKVRAVDSSARVSPFSAPDAATTMLFTDDPLVAGATPVKAVHVAELRQAVNFMRAAAGIGAFTFTDSNVSGLTVQALHLQQLRTALSAARSSLGLAAIAYTDPTLVNGSTVIKAVHFQELRNAVK
jgi:hypothetical protein